MQAGWNFLRNKMQQVSPGKAALLFFIAYLLLGVFTFDDYGVSTDEIYQIDKSRITLDYVFGRSDELLTYEDRHYGAVFPLLLQSSNLFFTDTRSIFLYRHLVTFLFFYGSVLAFYVLLQKLRLNKWLALAGTAMLAFHPHIYAHSFYNPKDIPFLAMWIYALLALCHWLQQPADWRRGLTHGAATGMLVVFRLPGVMMWAISGLAIAGIIWQHRGQWKQVVTAFLAFLFASFGTLFIFMPVLWHNPVGEFFTFLTMEPFVWTGKELFWGQFYKVTELPWYHWGTYLIVTTPLLILLLAGLGGVVGLAKIASRQWKDPAGAIVRFIPLVISVAILLVTQPGLYNGWRHVFFLYPMLVILAADGIMAAFNLAQRWMPRVGALLVGATLFAQALVILAFLVQSHPYQFTYYNWLAGRRLTTARNLFIMDYWGLSYTESFERIAAMDDRPVIKVEAEYWFSAFQNHRMLPAQTRERIQLLQPNSDERPDYFVSTFREYVPVERKNMVLVDQISFRDLIVAGIYQRK